MSTSLSTGRAPAGPLHAAPATADPAPGPALEKATPASPRLPARGDEDRIEASMFETKAGQGAKREAEPAFLGDRQPRPGYDSAAMLRRFNGVHAARASRVSREFRAATTAVQDEKELADVRLQLARPALGRLESQRECVRLGRGWFETPTGWLEADIEHIEAEPTDDPRKQALVFYITPKGGTQRRWEGLNFQFDAPQSAAGCCTIL